MRTALAIAGGTESSRWRPRPSSVSRCELASSVYEAGERSEGTRRNFCPNAALTVSIIPPTIDVMNTLDAPSSFLSRHDEDLSKAAHRREMRLLQLSIAGLMSVSRAERDAAGRFIRRSESMARSADPLIPLRAEWWEAI